MTNWTEPTTSTTYATLLDGLKSRDTDLAVGLDPAVVSPSNLPTGSIRWNSANSRWELKDASANWGALSSKYLIDVDKLDGQDGSYYLAWANLTGKPTTFTPSAHTHDDRYFTETESDGRFAGSLVVSGNSIKLQNKSGADLSTITVPYATSAGNATTVGGKSVDQNLRTTDAVSFASITTSGNASVQGALNLTGAANFYDPNSTTWRTLQWADALNDWQLEDNSGVMRQIFHEGHLPTWAEVSGKPTTFTPTTHSHDFGTM